MKTPRTNRVVAEIKNALQAQPKPEALHQCSLCGGELVYPVSWEQRAGERWYIERRCPDCESWHYGEHSIESVDTFDDALNEGTEQLLETLHAWVRAGMEADVEKLIKAINADAILPMDF
jgi:hypothetical protein